jgi:hypothetical protein
MILTPAQLGVSVILFLVGLFLFLFSKHLGKGMLRVYGDSGFMRYLLQKLGGDAYFKVAGTLFMAFVALVVLLVESGVIKQGTVVAEGDITFAVSLLLVAVIVVLGYVVLSYLRKGK